MRRIGSGKVSFPASLCLYVQVANSGLGHFSGYSDLSRIPTQNTASRFSSDSQSCWRANHSFYFFDASLSLVRCLGVIGEVVTAVLGSAVGECTCSWDAK